MVSRLDLKYRPRRFSSVLGNEGVVELLLKRSSAGTLTDQSMLFGGPKGTGKTTLARIVAMAIVCSNKQNGEPCGVCLDCQAVLNETSTCVEELDAASQGTVDHIREMVRDSEYEPVSGIGNVYILDEAQRLSAASQDAMLKAVENRSIMVIMCTTEPHKIRPPIRSRAEEYPISAPSVDSMSSRLAEICDEESIQYDLNALKALSQISGNCPRICIRALETLSVSGPIDMGSIGNFFRFSSYEDVDKVLSRIDENPRSAVQVFDDLMDREGPIWVRDAMLLAISSGLRVDVGAKHNYPCRMTFFQSRLREWAELARQLGMMERPTAAGILSALISTKKSYAQVPQVPQVPPSPTPPVLPSTVLSVPVPVLTPSDSTPQPSQKAGSGSELEVDGVRFSMEENLTTLDSKIEARQNVNPTDELSVNVEYRSDMEPMSDREFARGFISRIK
jgi:DNA polymerase III subunit gamma/tau